VFSIPILIKYLYCLIVILCISISTGFSTGNRFTKAIKLILAILLTLWITQLHFCYLVLPAFLAFVIMLKAKTEYKERYYL
jgi:hypothetical protein